MARRLAFVCLLAVATGCNAVLSIPERELMVAEDTSLAGETSVPPDSTNETIADSTTLDSTEPVDSGADTTVGADTATTDSAMGDSATGDSTTIDTMVVDTAVADTRDTAVPDTAMPDTTVVDTAMPDTATPDMGGETPTCGVTGMPCCGGIPGSCNTNSVCNQSTRVCVAAAGACVRSTDCPSSACGGPTSCAGNICFACTPTFGAKAFGTACSAHGECSTGVCDSFRGVCSAACSNGITSDADCAVHGTKVVCSELNWTTTGASGKIGFCAQGCERDADCGVTKVCRLSSNEDGNRLDLTCAPPAGATAYGNPCTSGSECPNGTCVGFGSTRLCTPFCKTSADCPTTSAWKNCGPLTYSRPKGGTQIVNACVP